MIRTVILTLALGLVLGSFVNRAMSNSNATVLQAAQGALWK